MSETKRKVPKLRFPGFTEDWEQRKLGDVVKVYDNLRVPIAESDRVLGGTPYYGANGIQGYIDGYTHNGEFVLIAEDGANDLENYPIRYVSGKVWVNNHAHVVSGLENTITTNFLGYTLKRSDIKSYIVGGSRSKLNLSDMLKVEVSYPNLVEQDQICNIMEKIDEIITLHQRKLESLKLKKKALLQKMFTKNGEQFPELRFPGFTDAWEQRKLGEVYKEVKSGLSRMLSNEDVGLPVVRANNINDGQLNLYDDIKYWYKIDPQGSNTDNYIINKNDILINFINSESKMGTAAFVEKEPCRNTIYTTNILRCRVDDEYDPYFVYITTFLKSYRDYIISITKPAVNQASFTTVDFKKFEIAMPVIEEQIKISNIIKKYNYLITLHQRKLEHLQLQKKALLQQMFV